MSRRRPTIDFTPPRDTPAIANYCVGFHMYCYSVLMWVTSTATRPPSVRHRRRSARDRNEKRCFRLLTSLHTPYCKTRRHWRGISASAFGSSWHRLEVAWSGMGAPGAVYSLPEGSKRDQQSAFCSSISLAGVPLQSRVTLQGYPCVGLGPLMEVTWAPPGGVLRRFPRRLQAP